MARGPIHNYWDAAVRNGRFCRSEIEKMSYHQIRLIWSVPWMYQWANEGPTLFHKHLFPIDAFFDRAIGRHRFHECPVRAQKSIRFLYSGFWPVFRFWPRLYDYVSRIITKCACISVIIFFGYTINPCIVGLYSAAYIIWREKKNTDARERCFSFWSLAKGVPRMDHICMFARSSVTRRSNRIDASGQQVAGALKAVFSRWVIVS